MTLEANVFISVLREEQREPAIRTNRQIYSLSQNDGEACQWPFYGRNMTEADNLGKFAWPSQTSRMRTPSTI